MLRLPDGNQDGPLSEDEFQDRLRAGKLPLSASVKSNGMQEWKPLLEVVSTDETFLRPSSMPPPPPKD